MQKIKIMKKLFLFAIALLLFGAAQLVGVCHNASKSFLTLTPYLVGL